jgi:hypothetical protein
MRRVALAGSVHKHHLRRSTVGLATVSTLVCCAPAAPAALADTRPVHLVSPAAHFTSFTCLNPSCSLGQATLAGTATSNLATGLGSLHATLIVDTSPGGSCNIVDESSAFIFDQGTIFVHSHHEDCATHSLRIDTTFQVTGGTGAFQDATGSGREFSAAPSPAVIYNGTISVMRRSTAAESMAVSADGPQHVKSTFPFDPPPLPAGVFCNFNYGEAATISLNAIIFADRETDHIAFTDTHTNLDTGFALTETGDFTVVTTAGRAKTVGIFWHLRNADGKLVVVQAGQVAISAAGEILKVTPAVNPDNAAVICPALGGQPANGLSNDATIPVATIKGTHDSRLETIALPNPFRVHHLRAGARQDPNVMVPRGAAVSPSG